MTTPTAWPTLGGRVQATITCPRCPWSATMRADDEGEITAFLPRQLQAHVDTAHRTETA